MSQARVKLHWFVIRIYMIGVVVASKLILAPVCDIFVIHLFIAVCLGLLPFCLLVML